LLTGRVDWRVWLVPLRLLGVDIDVEVLLILVIPDCLVSFRDLRWWWCLKISIHVSETVTPRFASGWDTRLETYGWGRKVRHDCIS
jgi:hypothetical protein